MSETEIKRENWIDDVKIIACALVVLGHFFQSMVKSQILIENSLYLWFEQTLYYFHVPLFFICSGYLYQKNSKIENFEDWKNHLLKKSIILGVPYFTFSTITWVLKTVFSDSINSKTDGIFQSLFLSPISPYWYLYCLFFIFLVTPTFKNKRTVIIGMVTAFILKIFSVRGGIQIYVVSIVFANEIWFVLGMWLQVIDFQKKINKKSRNWGIVLGLLFLLLSVFLHNSNIQSQGIGFLVGWMACTSVITQVSYMLKNGRQNRIFDFFAKYTMPIFVMHTIFAASLRSVLLKMEIDSAIIHMILGIGASFIGPIIAGEIMEKFACLDFLLYPGKYVKPKVIQRG